MDIEKKFPKIFMVSRYILIYWIEVSTVYLVSRYILMDIG